MKIELPIKVDYIIETLVQAGYEAYAVGGCVRDSLLHRVPEDWDITTSATPQQVKSLFGHTIDTGLMHGTVTVMLEKVGFEVTTYRIDGEYEDSRHPKEVVFTKALSEDLMRRDFTMNAMAYNNADGLIDLFGGIEDIRNGVIRCVGNPRERFSEDALRMMRAIRFSAQLGYNIEEKTKEAIVSLADTISKISAERIQTELVKILISSNPDAVRILYETNITRVWLPEFDSIMETEQNNPYHFTTVGEHTILTMLHTPCDKVLRLAALFHDIGKPACRSEDEYGNDHFYGHAQAGEEIAQKIMKRLRFDNETTQKVIRLIKFHDLNIQKTEKSMRRAIFKVGEDLMSSLLVLKKADCMAKSELGRKEGLEAIENLDWIYQTVLQRRDCLSLKDMVVSGKDLMEVGITPGREMGKTLSWLLDEVLEDPRRNTKEYLIAKAREFREKQ